MKKPETPLASLKLTALDGSNPLGFLAAIGTLLVARRAGENASVLRWERGFYWTPVLDGLVTGDPVQFSEVVAEALRGAPMSSEVEEARREAQRAFDTAKKAVEDRTEAIRRSRIRGGERRTQIETEVRQLERLRDEAREEWLHALARAVPRPELALGKHIDCTPEEFRAHVKALLLDAGHGGRERLDFLAAFASDACTRKSGRVVEATPFCFVTGSGHQYFLDTVRQLMDMVERERVRRALFECWTYQDEKLSLRWDPIEDRRYALMAEDPSPEGSRTVWMANLLAYRALALFPTAPGRAGLATTAWRRGDEPVLTWPIWEFPAGPETVRSLLQLRELAEPAPDRSILRARGVAETFRARRIKVGEGANSKLNFSPAYAP